MTTASPEVPFRVITQADVRASIRRAKNSLEKAAEEIIWQIEMEAWRTLGYSTWDAMRDAEYGDAAFMVPRRQRPELVARMRAAGLTQQQIADTAGVSVGTVNGDLKFSSENDESPSAEPVPTITNARGQQRPASYARTDTEFCRTCGADTNGCTCRSPRNTETGPVAADPAPITITCPTCGGTGKVTR